MNFLAYLQDGGQAPSIQDQVLQLVDAAMSGDESANLQIEEIFKAAEAGDPQALEMAQMIQEVALKMPQSEDPEEGSESEMDLAFKRGGKIKTNLNKSLNKMSKGGKSCPCQLKKVGGKIVEVNSCTGIPMNKNGNKIVKAQLGWLTNNAVRLVGDGIGTLAGKVHEYGQKAYGYGQLLVGGATQAVTGGQRGNGMVLRGTDNRATARAAGARTNRVIDESGAHLGNAAEVVTHGAQAFFGTPAWAAADAAISYGLGKSVGMYNPVTGGTNKEFIHDYSNEAEPDGTTLATFTPGTKGTVINAQPIAKLPVNSLPISIENIVKPTVKPTAAPTVAPEGRYSKYGMKYKTDDEGNVVEDWENTKASNRDIASAARSANWENYRTNRDAIRNSGMSFAQKQAALRLQRAARRQANRDARSWRNSQQSAYDEQQMAALNDKMTQYSKNGGIMSYTQYLN